MRYEGVIGFNTKQIWIYDNKLNIYIDPPTEVLNNITDWRDDCDVAINEIEEIANNKPDWLNDTDNWIDEEYDI